MNNFDVVMEKLSDQKYTKMSDIFKKGDSIRTSKDMADAKDGIKKATEFEKSGDTNSAKNEYKNALEKLKKCRKFVVSIRMRLQNSSMNSITAVVVGVLISVLSFFAFSLIGMYLVLSGYGHDPTKSLGGAILGYNSLAIFSSCWNRIYAFPFVEK